jgi:hypothetical protein
MPYPSKKCLILVYLKWSRSRSRSRSNSYLPPKSRIECTEATYCVDSWRRAYSRIRLALRNAHLSRFVYSPAARTLANLYDAVCVNISYRLAPMHEFPTAAHDTYDVVKWLSQNSSTLGANLTKGSILFSGSAGANLVSVAAQHWVSTASSPPITGLSLSMSP